MNLQHQIALTLRQRPLLAPMLLATLLLDVVLCLLMSEDGHRNLLLYWGLLLPQLGLLSLWLASSFQGWPIKFFLSGWFAAMLSLVYTVRMQAHGDLAGIASVLGGYLFCVLICAVLTNIAVTRWRPTGEALQFSIWQLLVITTVIAVLAPMVRYARWPLNTREVPVFLGLIGAPVVAWIGFRLLKDWWKLSLADLAWAGLFDMAYLDGGPDIQGFFSLNALVCIVWFGALAFKPDAKRRLAARRQRNTPQLTVVTEPAESLTELDATDPIAPLPTGLDTQA